MDSLVNQANNNLESLVSQISKNEFDLTKVLNTEDATPIQDTLLSSDKVIDQVNQKQTKKNVFTVGSKDEPIKPTKSQQLPNSTQQSPQAYKELKQSITNQFQQEQTLSQKLSSQKQTQSNTFNIKSEQTLSHLSNKLSNVIKTSKTADPIKLASSQLSRSPINTKLKQSIKEGYKNGNLLDKVDISTYTKQLFKSSKQSIESKIKQKIKTFTQTRLTDPINPINIDFNNGQFGIHVLRKRKQQNFNKDQDSLLHQIAKWTAQKINREIDCVLNLFKAHGILDMNFGIDLLARLKNISIFCDSGIAKNLGINDELTKILGAANDIEELLSVAKNTGTAVNDSTKTALRELYKSTRVLEQLDFLDKITKYSASYNDADMFEDFLNSNDNIKSMFSNISATTRGQLMDYVKDKGSYNATTSFIDTWGKHNIHRYKDTIVKSHNNTIKFNEDKFNNDKAKYQINMEQYFTPKFEEEPFKTSCIDEDNFQNVTLLSLNKIKEVSAFGNENIVPESLKESFSLLSTIPIS